MSMTETPVETPTKRKAKPRRKAAAKAPKAADDMIGLTVTACPTACNEDRCVISGIGICAHPRKGGLQSTIMSDEALSRLNRARKVLGKKSVDARFA